MKEKRKKGLLKPSKIKAKVDGAFLTGCGITEDLYEEPEPEQEEEPDYEAEMLAMERDNLSEQPYDDLAELRRLIKKT